MRYSVVAVLAGVAIAIGAYGWSAHVKARKQERKDALALQEATALSQPRSVVAELPNVLLIGDSISVGYTVPTREMLGGIANVYRVPDNAGPTTKGLARLEAWLEGRRWDVIHVNFGLHDLFREKQGGLPWSARAPRVEPDGYESNLRAIVRRLKATGAKVIVATTTPVPAGASRRTPGSERAYNAAAQGVAAQEGAALNDLHAMVLAAASRGQLPADVHFTAEGYRELGVAVVAAISRQLPAAAAAQGRPGDPKQPVSAILPPAAPGLPAAQP